jgi:hypothetical protein
MASGTYPTPLHSPADDIVPAARYPTPLDLDVLETATPAELELRPPSPTDIKATSAGNSLTDHSGLLDRMPTVWSPTEPKARDALIIRRRRLGLVLVTLLFLSVATAGAIVYGPDLVNPPPPEDSMLAHAQESVVTIDVIGDHFKVSGSGFFIDSADHVLTNFHVIKDAWKVTVTTRGGATLPARFVTQDTTNDLAELVVPIQGPPLSLRQEPAKVGEPVYVLGNPGGDSPNSTSKGTVAKVHISETVEGTTYTDLATTDALVRPGNSGGPVIDRRGHVLGVVSVGSQITGEGGFILDATFSSELSNWSELSAATDFAPPPPRIAVTESNFDGLCDSSGCPMHATVSNLGGPGVANVTFVVYASNKTTELAGCVQQVAVNKGESVRAVCTVNSANLQYYFYGYGYRQVWGIATVTDQSASKI